ncbi:MAG: hypothetical protein NZO16_06685, partial [Deltaproteobacteria bacterium]|nr:hypothetical protein [Deltaproteobacteria bacterium]
MSGFTQKVEFNYSSNQRREAFNGKVICEKGALVEPMDPVLLSQGNEEFIEVAVSAYMDLTQLQFIRGLRVEVGDSVETGQSLFKRSGILGFGEVELRSPVKGKVAFIVPERRALVLSFLHTPQTVSAFYRGEVIDTRENSVCIKCFGHLLQGVYGFGGEVFGRIKNLRLYDKILSASDITEHDRGCILVGFASFTGEAFRKASNSGVKGLVSAYLPPEVFDELGFKVSANSSVDLGFAVVITERFSRSFFQDRVRQFFEFTDGMYASVMAKTQIRAGSARPEIWAWGEEIPLKQSLEYRCVSDPFWDQRFRSKVNIKQDYIFPSGISTLAVRLENDQQSIVIPSSCFEEIK